MGKLTISVAIFHGYGKLLEGTYEWKIGTSMMVLWRWNIAMSIGTAIAYRNGVGS